MTAVGDLSVSLLAAGPSVSSQLFGSALIGVREGLEAAIVVTILVAFLVKSDRRDALKWVWLGRRRGDRHDHRGVPGHPVRQNTISGLGAEAIAGVASLIAVAIVTTMVIWMKKAAAGMSGQLRGDMSKALEAGAFAVLSLSFLAVGREGVETALFMVGFAEAKTLWPLTGLDHRRPHRRRDRLRHVQGRAADQPGEVLPLHRRVPRRRRRGHPVLRHRRAADRRLAARPDQPPVRHQLVVRLVVLVRPGHPGRLQRHARRRPGCSSSAGRSTSSSSSSSSCAPSKAPAKPADTPPPGTPSVSSDLAQSRSAPPHPKGPLRERLSPHREGGHRRSGRPADGHLPRRVARPRKPRPPPAAATNAPAADHGRRLRHDVRAVRHRERRPARAPSSSPTTAPRSPSSTSTARVTA